MIRLANMLLIGAAGRDSGKTTLACHVIADLAETHRPIGLKVTVIRQEEQGCPRENRHCSVCGSLEGRFSLTEETDGSGSKDTHRMVAAGAERVYWLRVRSDEVPAAMEHLLAVIPAGRPIVCESNTLRLHVAPGLFLQVYREGDGARKESARRVQRYVDRFVSFDGIGFDPGPEVIRFSEGRFRIALEATAVILSGGASSRMGEDKALLEIDGTPLLLAHVRRLAGLFRQVLVSTDTGRRYPFLDVPEVGDPIPGAGPLSGIVAGLGAARHERCLFVACDIPDLDFDLAEDMVRAAATKDAVVPRYPDGRIEPLYAVYTRRIAPVIGDALAAKVRRIRDIYPRCRVGYIDLERPIENLNTRDDLAVYRGIATS